MARAKSDAFKLYDATVRLGGSRNNEVRKNGVTAPEIMVLGAIHGTDSLTGITYTKKIEPRTDREERERLMRVYEGTEVSKRGFVARIFGPSTIPLPREVESDYAPQEQVAMQHIPAEIADAVDPAAALIG